MESRTRTIGAAQQPTAIVRREAGAAFSSQSTRRLPVEVWLNVLQQLDEKDRTPVHLSDLRSVNRDLAAAATNNVLWRLFSPAAAAPLETSLHAAFVDRAKLRTPEGNFRLAQAYTQKKRIDYIYLDPTYFIHGYSHQDPDRAAALAFLSGDLRSGDCMVRGDRHIALRALREFDFKDVDFISSNLWDRGLVKDALQSTQQHFRIPSRFFGDDDILFSAAARPSRWKMFPASVMSNVPLMLRLLQHLADHVTDAGTDDFYFVASAILQSPPQLRKEQGYFDSIAKIITNSHEMLAMTLTEEILTSLEDVHELIARRPDAEPSLRSYHVTFLQDLLLDQTLTQNERQHIWDQAPAHFREHFYVSGLSRLRDLPSDASSDHSIRLPASMGTTRVSSFSSEGGRHRSRIFSKAWPFSPVKHLRHTLTRSMVRIKEQAKQTRRPLERTASLLAQYWNQR